MPAQLPIFSRGTGPDSIASYDWLDVTSGTGYRTYYGTKSKAGTWPLTTRPIDGGTGPWFAEVTGGNNVNASIKYTVELVIVMNITSIIKGTTYIQFTHGPVTGAGVLTHRYYDLTVYHVTPGDAEDSLGTIQSTDRLGDLTTWREMLEIDLTTKKFAIGDRLRLKLEVWSGGDANRLYKTYFDPATLSTLSDGEGRTIGTDLTIDVPFKIDLT